MRMNARIYVTAKTFLKQLEDQLENPETDEICSVGTVCGTTADCMFRFYVRRKNGTEYMIQIKDETTVNGLN